MSHGTHFEGAEGYAQPTKKPPAEAGGSVFWCVSVREERLRSGL